MEEFAEKKEEPDTIQISTQGFHQIKKYLFKNNFVLIFSLLTLFSFVFLISQVFGFSLKINFLIQVTNLFTPLLWFLLMLSFLISAFLAYHEKYKLMFLPIIIWLLFTTAVVRTSNIGSLVNAATGEPSLGPDLDPYLFTRNAIEISQGDTSRIDEMRAAPLGTYNQYVYANLMPWSIFAVYKISNVFTDYSVTEAAIIAPVIFFIISLIGFFFFVYVLFSFKLSKAKAMAGAAIASFIYAFNPAMLHRTTAGIPELESLGMVWFWFAFLFFALAWKQDFISGKGIKNLFSKNKRLIIYGLLAGLFTGAMSWTWGGYRYIYMTIVLASFLVFFFEKDRAKNFTIFSSWFVVAIFLELLKGRFGNIIAVASSLSDTGIAIGLFLLMGLNLALFRTRLKNRLKLERFRLPEPVISLIVAVLLGIVLLLIVSPSTLFGIFSTLIERFFTPFGGGRVDLTVAENKIPYFVEALGNFGSIIWLFFFGLIILFYEATKHFNTKNKIGLNFFFILFISTFVFSRISPEHLLNGDNFISKFLYLGGLIVFGLFLIYTYAKAHKNRDEKTLEDFKNINFAYIFLLFFAFFGVMFMRSAIRFFFLAALPLAIVSSYLPIKLAEYWKKSKDSLIKLMAFVLLIVVAVMLVGVSVSYAQTTIATAPNIVPGPYNNQWQLAMSWAAENTPEDAIFTHWWDYGYWVQTLGQRATVADGGHPAGFDRNHFLGRYMLTTQNPETALAFMNSLEVTHLLIDSSDVGKYPAFSSIGSDKGGTDRLSQIPTMIVDTSQTRETNNSEIRIYQGGTFVDEDIAYNLNGQEIFLPQQRAAMGGVIAEINTQGNSLSFNQPQAVFIYNGQQFRIPLRYIYLTRQGEMIDFGSGYEAGIVMMPLVSQSGAGLQIVEAGAAIYLSPKTFNSLFAQLYLLDDPFDRYSTVNIAHVEPDQIVSSLNAQGAQLGDFAVFNGFRGPIKIWQVDYPEGTPKHEEYLQAWNIQAENNWGILDYLGV